MSYPLAPLRHVNGVPWGLAPLPAQFHLCKVQSWGFTTEGEPYAYCACGAVRYGLAGYWRNKNRRRKARRG